MAKLSSVVISIFSRRNEREGDAGGGPLLDGPPRIDGAAMVLEVLEECGRAANEARQPVERNDALRHGEMDSSGVAQGLWFSD